MEFAQVAHSDATLIREVVEEARQFWQPARVRLALTVIGVMLVVEVLVAAAMYAGADGPTGRAPEGVYTIVVTFFGLTSQWTKALFIAKMDPQFWPSDVDIDLTNRFHLAANVLQDLAAMLGAWLLPLFAALAFTEKARPVPNGKTAGARLWRQSAATVGPLALIAFVLLLASVVVEQILPVFHTPRPDPDAYRAERLTIVPWGSVGENVLVMVGWLVAAFVLIPIVAATQRERQPALAACFGTVLFGVTLLEVLLEQAFPGDIGQLPTYVSQYGRTVIQLLLAAVLLPFALRRLREEPT